MTKLNVESSQPLQVPSGTSSAFPVRALLAGDTLRHYLSGMGLGAISLGGAPSAASSVDLQLDFDPLHGFMMVKRRTAWIDNAAWWC